MRTTKQTLRIIEDSLAVADQLDYCAQFARISHASVAQQSTEEFLRKWWFHENIWEFGIIHLDICTSIGIGRELLRHRLMSPIQESTRYVDYCEKDMVFVEQHDGNSVLYEDWETAEEQYKNARTQLSPELARDVIPLGAATRIGIAINFREVRTILRQRYLNKDAHPQIRQLMKQLWDQIPAIVKVGLEDNVVDRAVKAVQALKGVCVSNDRVEELNLALGDLIKQPKTDPVQAVVDAFTRLQGEILSVNQMVRINKAIGEWMVNQ